MESEPRCRAKPAAWTVQLPLKFPAVGGVRRQLTGKLHFKLQAARVQAAGHRQHFQLMFVREQRADIQQHRSARRPGRNRRVEKILAHRVGHPPGLAGAGGHQPFRIGGITKHPAGSGQREIFQPRRQPEKTKIAGAGMKKFGDRAHVAVNGQHVRKTGEGGAEAAVQFRALAVDRSGRISLSFFRVARMQP